MRSHLLLDLLVARRNTLKSPDPLQCFTASAGLVWEHATHCTLEDLGRRTVVEGTTGRVDITPLSQEAQELDLVPKGKLSIRLAFQNQSGI